MNNSSKGKLKDPGVSMMNTSSKRGRRANAVIQVASCLVDGCNSDLSVCREYHRRHKVCELHSKTPKVTIQGQEKRFCQQCSRFHSLGEFDEGKRSCRRRLAGHNKRRRKPQLEPMPINSGAFLSDYQGTIFLHSLVHKFIQQMLQKTFSNEFFGGNVESSCARSLLSYTPAVEENTCLSLTGPTSSIYSAQSFIPRLHHCNDLGMQGEAVISNLVSDGSSNSSLLCIQDMFH
ncbi:hypothetical protein M0R45_021491 [Rubus argutus]|uniref:SBP-type domain-containing protein n=1 Tax=Rubus argutus TaxID=59490 RepID=A0AAW1XD99_RUBAR